jgi:hypothetical protein
MCDGGWRDAYVFVGLYESEGLEPGARVLSVREDSDCSVCRVLVCCEGGELA